MGMDSKKKIQDVKLMDSNIQENPFSTKEGQNIVSISETFWARAIREGRWKNSYSSGGTAPAGSLAFPTYVTPSKGCIFYPKTVTLSADVDAMLAVRIDTGIPYTSGSGNSSGQLLHYIFAKAGTPVILTFDGEIWANENGKIDIGCTAVTAGKFYGGIHGVEVGI
jgi:hypothetical protein